MSLFGNFFEKPIEHYLFPKQDVQKDIQTINEIIPTPSHTTRNEDEIDIQELMPIYEHFPEKGIPNYGDGFLFSSEFFKNYFIDKYNRAANEKLLGILKGRLDNAKGLNKDILIQIIRMSIYECLVDEDTNKYPGLFGLTKTLFNTSTKVGSNQFYDCLLGIQINGHKVKTDCNKKGTNSTDIYVNLFGACKKLKQDYNDFTKKVKDMNKKTIESASQELNNLKKDLEQHEYDHEKKNILEIAEDDIKGNNNFRSETLQIDTQTLSDLEGCKIRIDYNTFIILKELIDEHIMRLFNVISGSKKFKQAMKKFEEEEEEEDIDPINDLKVSFREIEEKLDEQLQLQYKDKHQQVMDQLNTKIVNEDQIGKQNAMLAEFKHLRGPIKEKPFIYSIVGDISDGSRYLDCQQIQSLIKELEKKPGKTDLITQFKERLINLCGADENNPDDQTGLNPFEFFYLYWTTGKKAIVIGSDMKNLRQKAINDLKNSINMVDVIRKQSDANASFFKALEVNRKLPDNNKKIRDRSSYFLKPFTKVIRRKGGKKTRKQRKRKTKKQKKKSNKKTKSRR